jgi:enoyl-CoA hydratase/carnithine racemase
MSLALACDYVVAASNAKFCSAFAKVALIPDVGLLWTLPQRVGMAKAKELITLAVEFDGDEAGRLGVANRVAEPGAALTAALEVAHRYAEMAPVAFALAKAAFADGSVNSLEGAMRAEIDSQSTLRKTGDHRAAAQAFLEKRKAKFTGD